MSNYKILAITAILAGTLTSCARVTDDGISPISQTSAAVTVGGILEKISETTAGKITEKVPETTSGTELQADDILPPLPKIIT